MIRFGEPPEQQALYQECKNAGLRWEDLRSIQAFSGMVWYDMVTDSIRRVYEEKAAEVLNEVNPPEGMK